MPEGDTLFRTARALGRALIGKPITGFRSTYPLLTRFDDDTPLTGQLVERVESRGKWLLIHFSGGATLATHLLMSGSWHIYRPGERWQQPRINMRILLENSDYLAVGFRVPMAQMHTAQSLARDRRIPRAELDVLCADFDAPAAAHRLLACAHEEVGDVLLHQEVLAGVGNVFKSEICFVTGINPFCRVADLTPAQAAALIATAQKLIEANVQEDSGDTIVTYRGNHRRTTHQSDPSESLWVYGRKGQPCRRCGEPVRSRMQGPNVRVTFWCQRCQPMPDGSRVDG
ncbi:MAG: Fpg/Nei family DNA glycosylase [Acidobacteriota bacterium]|nr:Fpg/Nei family DNA glycosylase [Acidobacteriota bacterium]